ncbi:glycosyltransferase family 4 protein [Methanolobus sp. WCC5]|uniref:glycosyltransferase family 4 protein n=1 Tax=Methanolobus sp. WCC5 TaxID=3125785 RepID=UPI003248D4F3
MKLLFIGQVNKNDGGSKRIVPLLSHIGIKGYETSMVVNSDDYDYLQKNIINANISTCDVTYSSIFSRFHRMSGIEREFILSVKMFLQSFKILKVLDTNIIYCFNPHLYSGGVGLICSRIFKKPFVLEFSDFSWEWNTYVPNSNTSNSVLKINGSIQKRILKHADIIITTPFLKEYCIKEGISKKKIYTIPCGADANIFNKKINYSDVVTKYELEGFNVIMYTGALYKSFGISDLLDAMDLVIKKHKNTKLVLVGSYIEKEMKEFIEKVEMYGLKDNVIFVELQPYSEIPKFINSADICVNPFPGNLICRAGSPVKVFEYMLCGKAVVHSDLECVEDVVTHGKTGLLYEADNVQDLADKITTLIENPELRKQLGDAAKKLILEKYTWDKLGDKLIECFISYTKH